MISNFDEIENKIGYVFKNKGLLEQAFIRKSYAEENGGQDNEILEFIGDKALDLAVIRILTAKYGKITTENKSKRFVSSITEGELTEIKSGKVQKNSLASCMDNLGFIKYLQMGNGDKKNEVQNGKSVKEDLFEAIVGAVILDSGWNMETVTQVVKKTLDSKPSAGESKEKNVNYVGKVQETAQKMKLQLPDYSFSIASNKETVCKVNVKGTKYCAQGRGKNQMEAKKAAAEKLYAKLNTGKADNTLVNEIKNSDYKSNPLKTLNELVQKKALVKPQYSEKNETQKSGGAVWKCTLTEKGISKQFTASGKSKQKARSACAVMLLDYMVNNDRSIKQ